MSLNETLSQPTVLSLSRTIAENKTAYYKAFDVVERPLNGSEATPFVAMMLDLVEQAQDAVLSDLAEKRVQLDDLKRRSMNSTIRLPKGQKIFCFMRHRCISSVPLVNLRLMVCRAISM